MKNCTTSFSILIVCLWWCFPSRCQISDKISVINHFCDSIDNVQGTRTVVKASNSLSLDYIFFKDRLVKLIEHPLGYRYISATVNYYIRDHDQIFVNSDMEISDENGEKLTVELQRVWLTDRKIIRYLFYSHTFTTDSLYKQGTDPVRISSEIRRDARFLQKEPDKTFTDKLLKALDFYIDLGTRGNGDRIPENIYSPFI